MFAATPWCVALYFTIGSLYRAGRRSCLRPGTKEEKMFLNRSFLLARILAASTLSLFAWPICGAAEPQASGTIAVRQTVQCCYREGSVSYVFVRRVGNEDPTTRVTRLLAPLEPTLLVGTQLDAGRYVISSFQRPCDGNCDFLNPPVDVCDSGPVDLRPGMSISLLVSVIPFGGCTISIEDERA
jgi:hypothetical protein